MRFGKSFWVVLFVGMALFGSVAVKADDTVIMRPVEKLGRGITNVAAAVFELPMKWTDVTNESGALAGITYGTLKGACYVVARVVVGAVDIATFLFPLPGCPDDTEDVGWGYGPIMTPAWVIPPSRDWNNFVYPDETVLNPAR